MDDRAAGRGLLLTALVVAAAVWSAAVAGEPTEPTGKWTPAAVASAYPDPDAAAKSDDFIGSLDCHECHEDRAKSLKTSFHHSLFVERKKDGTKGCEECHGPGFDHYDTAGEGPIRHPGRVDAKELAGVCLRCHAEVLTKPVDEHREWIQGKDGARSCTTCHSVHVDRSDPAFDPKIGPFATVADLEEHAKYIPAKTCIGCHDDFHPEMSRSGHAHLLTEGKTCGTCHGPGSLHWSSGGKPDKIVDPQDQTPRALNDSCNRCHLKGESVQRWTCSEHAREGISCIVCHDANAPKGKTLRAPEFELCGKCHLDVKAKFRLPNRHRVAEGRIKCSDCHDPHGNRSRVRDQDLRQRTCAKCHREKTGPFLFDHGIKRSDGCVACHEPHGSTNRRLLSHTRSRQLCLQCHPDSPHDLKLPKYRNCISCHIEIHGSDVDRLFLR